MAVAGGAFDEVMMRRALFHAARGAGRTTPNPMVGAVVVDAGGVVAGHGWHERAGEPHAEVNALNDAGERARGGTMYVTLEPCCHTGRTGPCTQRLIDAGVTRVVAAMTDPDPRVSGRGFAELQRHGIIVEAGMCETSAQRLNQAFVSVKKSGRPLVLLKAAAGIDAVVAAGPGRRTPITSREANRRTQILRASVDAVAIGSETLLVDDPLLTARDCHRIRPLARVVFDRRLRSDPRARLFSTLQSGPVIIVTVSLQGEAADRAAALERAGAEVIEAASLADGLQALAARDISTVLVEGGPTLQAALVKAGLVDRLHLIVAPHVVGVGGIKWLGVDALDPFALAPVAIEPRGPDIWIEADVHGHR
jgi:diaminohydroxyphosphoribosylaminopyrimidine deaminase/5-amino-6-(5-phosphoribosylamino)uracil reductase